jgi:hypothetical protein
MGHHWVLLRRNDTTGEIAYYRTFSEECFQTCRG